MVENKRRQLLTYSGIDGAGHSPSPQPIYIVGM
jgi:hypothetical protein